MTILLILGPGLVLYLAGVATGASLRHQPVHSPFVAGGER